MQQPKLWKQEKLTIERMLAAKVVRATDGCISRLLWANPLVGPTDELFVEVDEVTEEYLQPVVSRITDLLLAAERPESAP